MRLVQVTVPAGKRDAILKELENQEIDYVVTRETSNREFTEVIYFPLPAKAVEPVLDGLKEVGLGDDAYTVVVDAETVISRRFEKLKERYEEEEKEERISRQELRARAEGLLPDTGMYLALTLVSVIVATAGVLLDSPAVVVGSMVIAPLIGPAMATAVGSVIDEPDLFRRGVKLQVIGGGGSILAAAIFAILVKESFLIPPGIDLVAIEQISGRATPGVLSLAVAVGAGIAGALSLSATISASLVGVAIAVALVPPTAVIGIGIAWGRPVMAIGALVLVLV
ncbi:MAG: TIGR00341 family protein, partial [Halobacteriaceae archaeon]